MVDANVSARGSGRARTTPRPPTISRPNAELGKTMNNEKIAYNKPVVTDLGVQKDFVQATSLGGDQDNIMIGKLFGSTSP